MIPLFELNPKADRRGAAARYRKDGRVQLRDFLTQESATTVARILAEETPWGLAWRAAGEPRSLRAAEVRSLSAAEREAIAAGIAGAAREGDYAFLYGQYPMLDAYLQRWGECEALDLLLEHINSEPFLELVREVTALAGLIKADAQATLYGPGHFLGRHDDTHVAEGWRVAYVMSFASGDWRPDWGGYLLFYDADGDVVEGLRPRFNALNLFAVPQNHSVSFVPPFAPEARLAVSGWFRER